MCGGTIVRQLMLYIHKGLSPRVRGNRDSKTSEFSFNRTIPACAGEPISVAGLDSRNADYPRVCGGTIELFNHTTTHQGLSPRVRGNLPGVHPEDSVLGTIPACAGEPA